MPIGEVLRVSSESHHHSVEPGKRSSELRLRLISAAIGLPLIGVILYLGFWTISTAAMIIAAIAAIETHDMLRSKSQRNTAAWFSRVLSMIMGAAVPAAGILIVRFGSEGAIDALTFAAIFLFVALLIIILGTVRFRQTAAVAKSIVLGYGAIVVLSLLMLPPISSLEQGRELLTFAILVVFATDTGAYFVGKRFGRRKLAPTISPGKTWEGLLGGAILAILASSVLAQLLSLELSITRIVLTGLTIASAGVVGDLTESWVKRVAGVKDSGTLVAGHGGIMDRLDALAPNFMLIYLVGRWLG